MPIGSPLKDRMLLLGTALLLIVVSGTALFFGEIYQISPAWFFFAWNAAFLFPLIRRDFERQLKRPLFIAFLVVWMCVHGLVMLALKRWVPILYWMPIVALELFIGYVAACTAFELPSKKQHP